MVLLPISWETHSAPSMRGAPQNIINDLVTDKSDLIIGIFWIRLGTPTDSSISGTVEEIENHIADKRPVMLFFSNAEINPEKIDPEQYKKLKEFKSECKKRGLYYEYNSLDFFRRALKDKLAIVINNDPYFEEIIDDDDLSNPFVETHDETQEILNQLSEESKLLLVEAAKSSNGDFMAFDLGLEYTVQVSGRKINKDKNPREKARWKEAVEFLDLNDLIRDKGYKGEIYELTDKGFRIADFIIENNTVT